MILGGAAFVDAVGKHLEWRDSHELPERRPCPFCGGKAEMKSYQRVIDCETKEFIYVYCDVCGARGREFVGDTTTFETFTTDNPRAVEAVEAWNKRVGAMNIYDVSEYL